MALIANKKVSFQESDEPTNFGEEWHHPNSSYRAKWQEEIKKELNDMRHRNFWSKIKCRNGMRTIGLKWVFKVKSDGRYRAILVDLGYRQK